MVHLESSRPHCDNSSEGLLWYNYTSSVLYKCEEPYHEWSIIGYVQPTTENNKHCKRIIIKVHRMTHYIPYYLCRFQETELFGTFSRPRFIYQIFTC